MEEFDIVAALGGHPLGPRFAVYIPNKDRDGRDVVQKPWVDEAIRILSDIGGGATAMPPVNGAWLNPETQKLILEEPILVYSHLDPIELEQKWDRIRDFVKRLGKGTNQGSIAVEYDGVFFLISDFD